MPLQVAAVEAVEAPLPSSRHLEHGGSLCWPQLNKLKEQARPEPMFNVTQGMFGLLYQRPVQLGCFGGLPKSGTRVVAPKSLGHVC